MIGPRQAVGRILRRIAPNERVYSLMRFEAQCGWQRLCNGLSPTFHRKVRALWATSGLSLNVGAGGDGRPGWLNVDAFHHECSSLVLDVRRPLPLRTGSVRRVFASHVVEHIDFRDNLLPLLRELHRVLEPGGVLRIVVPDARRFVEAYVSGDEQAWRDLGWDLARLPHDLYTPMHVVNHIFHQGGEHCFGYDYDTLALALRTAGFGEVIRQQHSVSCDPELAIDAPGHAPYSLYVDARK